MLRFLKFMLLALLATAHVQADYQYVYDDGDGDGDGEYDEDYVPSEVLPTFIAKPQIFSVEIGGDITFPCDVQDQGNHVLMFQRMLPGGDHRLLYVGNYEVKSYKNLVKVESSFVLSGVKKHHAGEYVCRIETTPTVQLIHTLHVQYPASVERVSPEVQHVVQGSSVTLQCNADGNPPAAISWSRKQGHLPSGQQSEEGLSITLENVDRHVEGTYICTASNGIGLPSSASMTIEVEYPPEVITEQAILHTGEGDEAKLMCNVHGRPTPAVMWTKDGKPLDASRHISEHDSLHRHTLTIKEVMEEDFGEYTCTAKNNLGNFSSTLRLTGLPKIPLMTSSPAGGEKTSYTLTWETESYTPISMYRLQYRKYKPNIAGQPQEQWNVRLHQPKPSVHNQAGPRRRMTHAIETLEPATDYEARVAVENKFGWSNFSDVFRFYTRREDPTTTTTTTTTTTLAPESEKIAPVKEVAYQSSAISGCERVVLSLAVLVLSLAVRLS